MASRGSEADGGESVGRRSSVGGGGWGVTLQETAFGATNPALGAGAGSEREAGRRRGSSVVDDRAASAGDVGMRVTVDRDLVEAARGGALAVPLTELAGRMERSAVTSTSAVTRTSIRPRALVAELMQSQQPLLVLEFSKGSSATTYRWMRRTEILAEARRATAAISAPVIVRSPQGLPPVAPLAGVMPAGAAPLLRIDSNATAASGLPSVGGAPARIKQKGAVTSLLQSRDLRVVDSAFEIGSEPAILVRKHCIVVNLPPVRAIIMYNKCFFFPEEGADSELVPILQRLGGGVSSRVAGGAGADAAGADGGAPVAEHHAPDAGGDDASQMPFEFFVFETMLSAVVEELTNQYNSIRPQASEVVLQLTEHRAATAKLFERLRKVKRSLADFLSRLKSINRVLSELLDTSEDLRSMALTALVGVEGAASTAGSAFVDSSVLDDYEDAAEVLLESYLAEVEAVITKAKLAREDVEASEHQLNLVLANNRNRLLKTEIGITTMTMTMTACSVVAGIFGMNVLNGFEEDHSAFLKVSIGSVAAAIVLSLLIMWYLRAILR